MYEEAELEAWKGDTIGLSLGKENSGKANEAGTDVPRLAANPVDLDQTKKPITETLNQETTLTENETIDLC